MQKKRFFRALWALTKPFWVSEKRAAGLTLLATVVAATLLLVWFEVQFNTWNREFYNTFETRDADEFVRQVGVFTILALVWIVLRVYKQYFQQMLMIEWRTWLTERFLGDWLKDRAYYRLQLLDQGTDNPDQRIADDLNAFVDLSLTLALGLLSSMATLTVFVGILWALSEPMTVGGFTVDLPGWLLWAAVLYALPGTWLAHLVGRKLIGINFELQKQEANFRYALVRLRENAEAVALYRGEKEEYATFRARFGGVIAAWWAKMVRQKNLTWFQSFYGQLAIIFPLVVSAPRFFSGQAPLGYIFQVASAFGQVQTALSWFIDAYAIFANWKATVDRLVTFTEAVERVRMQAVGGERAEGATGELSLERLELGLPQGQALLAGATLKLKQGESVLVTGPSGSGKSTLFRALAGIWPYWKGKINLPAGAKLLFLPQRPYLPIGTLKHAVAYPGDAAQVSDEEARAALTAVGLPKLADELAREENWAQLLSGGEQQRLAIARALLNKPDWLFMDEPTAALPDDAQAALYALLKEKLPVTTLVSIGHRAELERFHARKLVWGELNPG